MCFWNTVYPTACYALGQLVDCDNRRSLQGGSDPEQPFTAL